MRYFFSLTRSEATLAIGIVVPAAARGTVAFSRAA